MEQKIKKNSFIIGIIGATITAAIYIYIWKYKEYTNTMLGVFTILYPIVFGVTAQIFARFTMKGHISFKQVVLAYFICILLIFFTEAVINYLIFNVIDPDAKELALDALRAVHKKTQSGLARAQVFKEPAYSASEYSLGFCSKVLFYIVPGLITGLIISKIPQR